MVSPKPLESGMATNINLQANSKPRATLVLVSNSPPFFRLLAITNFPIASAGINAADNQAAANAQSSFNAQAADNQAIANAQAADNQAAANAQISFNAQAANNQAANAQAVSNAQAADIQAAFNAQAADSQAAANAQIAANAQASANAQNAFNAQVANNQAAVNAQVAADAAAQGVIASQVGGMYNAAVPAAGLGAGSVTQIYDGQVQAPGYIGQVQDMTPISQIYDGQIQATGYVNQIQGVTPISQVYDGQVQAMTPVNQIYDGQLQAVTPVNQIYDGQVQAFGPIAQVPQQYAARVLTNMATGPIAGSVSQIYDGQIQAPSLVAQAQSLGPINQAQAFGLAPEVVSTRETLLTPQAEALYTGASTGQVTQIMDGQIQAPAEIGLQGNFPAQVSQEFVGQGAVPQSPSAMVPEMGAGTITQIADGQVQVKRSVLESRQNGVPVDLSLNNGILTDHLGRTGYIASNRQLQFDAPPQGGAVITSGFSACGDGTLALGGSNTFYACGSSDCDSPVTPN